MVYLFVQFSKPVGLKQEEDESDSEQDERRDLNIDFLYYVKNMPTFQRIKDVDYNVDIYTSAKEYLFEDEGKDGEFITVDQEHFDRDEIKIELFKNEVVKNWG